VAGEECVDVGDLAGRQVVDPALGTSLKFSHT
jgi:hypothetical protein